MMQGITNFRMHGPFVGQQRLATPKVLPRRGRAVPAPLRASSATFADGAGEVGEVTFANSVRPPDHALDDTVSFLQAELPRIFKTGPGYNQFDSMVKEQEEYGIFLGWQQNRRKEITASRYSNTVTFEDPISRFNDKNGYMLMVRTLKTLFNITFDLHDVKAIQPDQIITRWSMIAKVWELPWQPTLLFSGKSFYKVDPTTGIILSQRDVWDSVDNNRYLSSEAVAQIVQQVQLTPDLEQPGYQLLRVTKEYEIRRYDPFIVAETALPVGETPASGTGFMDLANYIFGGNNKGAKMEMTTPVFTRSAAAAGRSTTSMQFPMEKKFADVAALPQPNSNKVVKKQLPGRYVAAIRFTGLPFDWEVTSAEGQLRRALARDGLQAAAGYSLARYNEPFVPPPVRRNEVLIDLVDFEWPMP